MNTWAADLMQFYIDIHPPHPLPNGIQWLHPQQDAAVVQIMQQFFQLFYNDADQRTLLLGINPGRFGAGITGVNFTAARQLSQYCDISHSLKPQSELSAEFIYEVIEQFGGPHHFYSRFFIGSVCPLGFVKGGKNLNYYDDKQLLQAVEPFILQKMAQLISFPVNRTTCFCIGGEKNFTYLNSWNKKYHWFTHLIALPHPRFIMQYKRKNKQHYIDQYVGALSGEKVF